MWNLRPSWWVPSLGRNHLQRLDEPNFKSKTLISMGCVRVDDHCDKP
jgi:hypothetical protein